MCICVCLCACLYAETTQKEEEEEEENFKNGFTKKSGCRKTHPRGGFERSPSTARRRRRRTAAALAFRITRVNNLGTTTTISSTTMITGAKVITKKTKEENTSSTEKIPRSVLHGIRFQGRLGKSDVASVAFDSFAVPGRTDGKREERREEFNQRHGDFISVQRVSDAL